MMSRLFARTALLAAPAFLLFACSDSGSSGGAVLLAGPQTGGVSIDPATGAVTITTQPQAFVLTGTAVITPAPVGGSTLTLSLRLINNSTQVIHNPKVLVTNISEGADIGSDGPFGIGTDPYYYYGPMALATGGNSTRDIAIGGTFTGPVTFDLEVIYHPSFFITDWSEDLEVNDSSGTSEGDTVDGAALGFDVAGGSTGFHAGVSSSDGRYVYMGSRNQPAIVRLDTTTHALSTSANLVPGAAIAFDGTGPIGQVDGVTMSPDGNYLYAVVNDGAHSYRTNQTFQTPTIWVVKVARTSLAVISRTAIQTPPPADGTFPEWRGRTMSLTTDGAFGAVCVTGSGMVHKFDTTAMAVVDSYDVSAMSTDGSAFDVRSAAISPDGDTIFCSFIGNDGSLAMIDSSGLAPDGGLAVVSPPTLSSSNYSTALAFGPDGRLYYGRHNYTDTGGLSVYDLTGAPDGGPTWNEIPDIMDCYSVTFSADGTIFYAYDRDNSQVTALDVATDTVIPNPFDGADTRALFDSGYGHVFVVTP